MNDKMTVAGWQQRFAGDEYYYGEAPNRFLADHAGRIPTGGEVLVPGDGEGRNGVWLARQGLRVTSVDMAASGLVKAQALADRHRVAIATVEADLLRWDWPLGRFDAVAAIFVHLPTPMRVQVHRAMLAALKPGGLLLLQAFTPGQLAYQAEHGSGGPRHAGLLYQSADLRADFADANFLHLAEHEEALAEGAGHQGLGHVIDALVEKPR